MSETLTREELRELHIMSGRLQMITRERDDLAGKLAAEQRVTAHLRERISQLEAQLPTRTKQVPVDQELRRLGAKELFDAARND